MFNEIKKYYREFDLDFIKLQRGLPPLALRILDSIEVRIRSNNNHLYGYSDYQVLLSNTKRLRDNIIDSKNSFDLMVTVLQFLEKLSASKHQVKISNKNIIVNGDNDNVNKCIALSNSFGNCGLNEEAPFTTLNAPSLSRKILSILAR